MITALFLISATIAILAAAVFGCALALKLAEIVITDVPFVPTSASVVDEIIQHCQLSANSVLYDLGCGDARVIRRAVERYQGTRAVGIEIAPIPYLLAKFRTRNNSRVTIRRGNIFNANIADATHIFLYMFPEVANAIIENIREQCAPGTRIISCDYAIASLVPSGVVDLNNGNSMRCRTLFMYTL